MRIITSHRDDPLEAVRAASDRRQFLRLTLTGGVAAAILAKGNVASGQVPNTVSNSVPCLSDINRVSAADAVLIYASLLESIENTELLRLGGELSEASRALTNRFKKIDELALKLGNLVCPAPETEQRVSEIRSLSKAIRENIEALDPLTGKAIQAQLVTIRLMCQQLSKSATCVHPNDTTKFNSKALETIGDLAREVDAARVDACNSESSRAEWKVGANDLKNRLDIVRDKLGKAVGDVLTYEKTPLTSSIFEESKATAVASLSAVASDLRTFPEYINRKQVLPDHSSNVKGISAIELIVFLLEGTVHWLESYVRPTITRSTRSSSDVRFLPAKYEVAASLFEVSDKSIENLLVKYCKEATPGKVSTCRNSCAGAWGWLAKKAGVTLHVAAVHLALTGGPFGRWEKLVCTKPPNPNLEGLAEELVGLFTK